MRLITLLLIATALISCDTEMGPIKDPVMNDSHPMNDDFSLSSLNLEFEQLGWYEHNDSIQGIRVFQKNATNPENRFNPNFILSAENHRSEGLTMFDFRDNLLEQLKTFDDYKIIQLAPAQLHDKRYYWVADYIMRRDSVEMLGVACVALYSDPYISMVLTADKTDNTDALKVRKEFLKIVESLKF